MTNEQQIKAVDTKLSFTLEELAVLEAAERGLISAKKNRRFDPQLFQAVAEFELRKIKEQL